VLSVVAITFILEVTALSSSRLGDVLLRSPAEPTVDVGNLRHIRRVARVAFQVSIHGGEGFPDTIVADDSLFVDKGLQRCLKFIVSGFHVNSTVVVRDHLLDVGDGEGGVQSDVVNKFHIDFLIF